MSGSNFQRIRTSTANKTHECCECDCQILPGDRYERVMGCWLGEFQTFKTCAPCAALRELLQPWLGPDEEIPFGQLHSEFEWAQQQGFRLHPLQQLAIQAL